MQQQQGKKRTSFYTINKHLFFKPCRTRTKVGTHFSDRVTSRKASVNTAPSWGKRMWTAYEQSNFDEELKRLGWYADTRHVNKYALVMQPWRSYLQPPTCHQRDKQGESTHPKRGNKGTWHHRATMLSHAMSSIQLTLISSTLWSVSKEGEGVGAMASPTKHLQN